MDQELEKWQLKINQLNDLRLKLGYNFNSMQNKIGISRARLQSFFEKKHVPGLDFFIKVEDFLNSEIEVQDADIIEVKNTSEKKGKISKMKKIK